jgi:hypothetical protein
MRATVHRFLVPVALIVAVFGLLACRLPESSERSVTIYVSTDRVFSEPVLREGAPGFA